VSAQEFGTLLRQHRRAAGLTQVELAAGATLSVRTVSDLERGRTGRPYPQSLRMLIYALGLCDEDQDQLLRAIRRTPASAGTRDAGRTVAVPHQLPSDVRYFAGRDDELALLTAIRDGSDGKAVVISAITGMGGVGKTALAVRWAHEVADGFTDGQLFLDLRGFDAADEPLEPIVAMRVLLDGLGEPADRLPAGEEAQLGLYRSMLAGKRMLIVLDNARDERQVRPLLPGGGCMVLVTSRSQLAGLAAVDGAAVLDLDGLSDAGARRLLRDRLGARRVSMQPGAVTELVELCAGLPLALSVLAARAAARPGLSLDAFADQLRQGRHRLDALEVGDAAGDLRTVFAESYRASSESAAQTFRLLSVHPGPSISAPAMASLAGLRVSQARHDLGELAGASLIGEHAQGRFTLHKLLRAYAVELERDREAAGVPEGARRRLLDHYLRTAQNADHMLYGVQGGPDPLPLQPRVIPERFADHQEALAWFLAEHEVLVAVARDASATGIDDIRACLLVRAVTRFLRAQGRWQEVIALQDMVAEAARRDEQGPPARARPAVSDGADPPGAYWQVRGVLEQALRLLEQLGDESPAPSPPADESVRDILSVGRVRVDLRRHLVTVNDREVHLTFKEFGILAMLAAAPGHVITRELIMAKIWGYDGAVKDTRTLRVHISLLRKKLNAPDLIETVYGVGFRLVA
jgi:transcriptional regulator with XRE-family HTH domain